MATPLPERLMVLSPFGDYAERDLITEEAAIRRVLKTHPDFVLRLPSTEQLARVDEDDAATPPKGR